MANISTRTIANAIYEATKGKSGSELDNALKSSIDLLSRRKLLGKSNDILEKLEEIIDQDEGVTKAKVTSKNKLDKKEIEDIEELLKKKYKSKEVQIELKENKELIGGVKIEVKDEIMDFSLKNSINQLQVYLTKN